MHAQSLSCVQLFVTPWTAAHQASLSEVSRQEHWSKLPFPSSEDLPDPGIKPKSLVSPVLEVDSLPLGHLGSPSVQEGHRVFEISWTDDSSGLQAMESQELDMAIKPQPPPVGPVVLSSSCALEFWRTYKNR